MKKSEHIGELAKALVRFKSKCPDIKLDQEVEIKKGNDVKYKYKYASLTEINRTITPILVKCGLTSIQLPVKGGGCAPMLIHTSGQFIIGDGMIVPFASNDPRSKGSATSYERRYGQNCILSLVTETDDDAELAAQMKIKPVLSDAAYKKAKDRIMSGEQKIYEQCKAHFELSAKQESEMLNLVMEYSSHE